MHPTRFSNETTASALKELPTQRCAQIRFRKPGLFCALLAGLILVCTHPTIALASQIAPPADQKPNEGKSVPDAKTNANAAASPAETKPGEAPAEKEEIFSDDPGVLYKMAKEAYKAGKFLRASMLFEKAYAVDPNPTLLLNSAHMHVKAGDYLGASELYRQVFSNAKISEAVRDSAQRKLSDIIPFLSHAWLHFSSKFGGATCVVDGAVVDSTSAEAQELNPGVHLVGWKSNPGEFSFGVKNIAAGTTITVEPELDAAKIGTIKLEPALPGTRIIGLGNLSVAVPKGTTVIQTSMRYSGELVLLGADGAPLARRIIDLEPGEKVDWAWSKPARAMIPPPGTATAEMESDFPWKWVIIGGVTVAVAAGATAYFMMQDSEPAAPDHVIDLGSN